MSVSSGIKNAHSLGKQMLKDCKGGLSNYTALYGVSGNDMYDEGHVCTNHACHAGLGYIPRGKATYLISKIVDALLPSRLTYHQRKMWYSFILKRSIYSRMFAQNSIKRGMKNGYFVYHADTHANLLLGGAIAVRMASEKPHIVEFFCGMVDAGADESAAFLAAHTLGISRGNIKVRINSQGHVPIYLEQMNTVNVRRYFKADVAEYEHYSVARRYSGVHSMFGESFKNKPEFINTLKSRFEKAIANLEVDREMRIALFNLSYNQPKENTNRAVKSSKAYPILATILNEYKQEILNEEA